MYDLLYISSAYKTDLYNISKVRSFVYTSLPTFAVHNIDIVARPTCNMRRVIWGGYD